ncbi:hypothetical protein PINS_up020920 [Pythium insidiosum]|nr:hypothetical protein PINS_up013040 [Pythium insidiosum]GLE09311.1 hypothetical protein PINS_up020920 [Pythium insidiosum]
MRFEQHRPASVVAVQPDAEPPSPEDPLFELPSLYPQAISGRGYILDAKNMDERERKRAYHREAMALFRQRKKERLTDLKSLHLRLEAQVQERLALRRAILLSGLVMEDTWSNGGVHTMPGHPDRAGPERLAGFQNAFCGLVEQAEALREENRALQQLVAHHTRLRQLVHHELKLLYVRENDASSPLSTSSTCSTASSDDDSAPASSSSHCLSELRGFFTYFVENEPPFYFEPFTMDECQKTIKAGYSAVRQLRDTFAMRALGMQEAHCLGWRAQRSLHQVPGSDGLAVSRVRFTKRIRCSESSESTMEALVQYTWKVLTTPELYTRIQRTRHVSQLLQTLGDYMSIFVRNAPHPTGDASVRFLNLLTRVDDVVAVEDGGDATHAQTTLLMLIPDSERHRRLRELEHRPDILWMTEGSAFISFTQINDDIIEVDYGNVATCIEAQAKYFLIEIGAQLIRWENLVMPPRLLRF